MESAELKQLLSLFTVRPEAHAFQVARGLGAYRGAEHLKGQIQDGIVAPTAQSSALVAASMTLAAEGMDPDQMPERLLVTCKTDMGLQLALEEAGLTSSQAVAAWIHSLTPAPKARPRVATARGQSGPLANPSHREPTGAGSFVWPRDLAEAKEMGLRKLREPLNIALLGAFVLMAGYKLVLPPDEAKMFKMGSTQQAQNSDPNLMFPGLQANPNYRPEDPPKVAEPLPVPAIPDGTEPEPTPPAPVPPAPKK